MRRWGHDRIHRRSQRRARCRRRPGRRLDGPRCRRPPAQAGVGLEGRRRAQGHVPGPGAAAARGRTRDLRVRGAPQGRGPRRRRAGRQPALRTLHRSGRALRGEPRAIQALALPTSLGSFGERRNDRGLRASEPVARPASPGGGFFDDPDLVVVGTARSRGRVLPARARPRPRRRGGPQAAGGSRSPVQAEAACLVRRDRAAGIRGRTHPGVGQPIGPQGPDRADGTIIRSPGARHRPLGGRRGGPGAGGGVGGDGPGTRDLPPDPWRRHPSPRRAPRTSLRWPPCRPGGCPTRPGGTSTATGTVAAGPRTSTTPASSRAIRWPTGQDVRTDGPTGVGRPTGSGGPPGPRPPARRRAPWCPAGRGRPRPAAGRPGRSGPSRAGWPGPGPCGPGRRS